MFSLESPHRGDSNKYIQLTIFNIKKKITINCPKSAAMGFFRGTHKRVRNSHGKRAITVRATEVLLYFYRKELRSLDANFSFLSEITPTEKEGKIKMARLKREAQQK